MNIKITPQAFRMPEIGPRSAASGGGRGGKPASLVSVAADWERLVVLFLYALMYIRNERTQEGRTVDGRPLLDGSGDKYSPQYAKRKAQVGRTPYTPGDRLVWSGAMMDSQHPDDVSPTHGKLVFSPEEAPKAYKNNLLRPFIQFTPEEIRTAWSNALKQWRKTR